jgi:hypothetical protein
MKMKNTLLVIGLAALALAGVSTVNAQQQFRQSWDMGTNAPALISQQNATNNITTNATTTAITAAIGGGWFPLSDFQNVNVSFDNVVIGTNTTAPGYFATYLDFSEDKVGVYSNALLLTSNVLAAAGGATTAITNYSHSTYYYNGTSNVFSGWRYARFGQFVYSQTNGQCLFRSLTPTVYR